ncbi:MAG: aminoacyl-tRNA deacylase [Gemmataceae bacterium]
MRVAEFLADKTISYETLLHPPAFTAQKRAKFLRLSGREVAKSVLLFGPREFLLAVLPATKHIDTGRLAEALGGPVRVADNEEVARTFWDCEWGVVPPFGSLYGLPTVLDDTLSPDTLMVFEANTHGEAIRMLCCDYERLVKPQRLRFSF